MWCHSIPRSLLFKSEVEVSIMVTKITVKMQVFLLGLFLISLSLLGLSTWHNNCLKVQHLLCQHKWVSGQLLFHNSVQSWWEDSEFCAWFCLDFALRLKWQVAKQIWIRVNIFWFFVARFLPKSVSPTDFYRPNSTENMTSYHNQNVTQPMMPL